LKRDGVPKTVSLMAVTCFGWGAAAWAGPPQSVRLETIALHTEATRASLTLSLSGPVSQHVFSLHNPERLVIDLPSTQRRARLPAVSDGGPIVGMRSGRPNEHSLRLVVALRGSVPARLTPSVDASRYRLQIDFGAAQSTPMTPQAAPVNTDTGPAPQPAHGPQTRLAAVQDTPVPSATRRIRALHAPEGERDIIVAVDAGHGGDDPGATGQSGTHEKDVTLAIARALAARIDRESGIHAVLTRDGDYFVALPNRIARARTAHADMFVSIHADAVRDREVSGASVYILSERGASSVAAKLLAEKENAADLKGGISLAGQRPDIRSVLLDLTQSAAIGQSVEAADRVLGALDRVGAVRKHDVQQAAFVVLKSPDIPSMLVETAYISNPLEERKLSSPAEQSRLADAIFSGIDGYFRKYPPEGSQYSRGSAERVAADITTTHGG
jgi:N-acetylmuramoyl-L-alanine amidase